MFAACREGRVDVVYKLSVENKILLSTEFNVKSGLSPVYLAAQRGHHNVVRYLGDNGVELDAQLKCDGTTPLYVACHRGHMEVVRLLVDRKVDLDVPASNGWTPVHIAARKGHHEVVRILTNHGADLNKAALDGATPLYAAVLNDHFDVAKLLLKKGADPNLAIETGELPVMIAARGGHFSLVQMLAETTTCLDCSCENGQTALLNAIEGGHFQTFKLLLDSGADPKFKVTKVDGQEPELKKNKVIGWGYPGASASASASAAVVEAGNRWASSSTGGGSSMSSSMSTTTSMSYNRRPNPTSSSFSSANPSSNKSSGIRSRSSSGGSGGSIINRVVSRGKTDSPLYRAAQKGRVAMARILAQHGVAVDEGDGKNLSSPLIAAIEGGCIEIVKLLVEEYGADVNKAAAGRTPVYIATKEKEPSIVKLLASHGADLNRVCMTSLGINTPLHAACQMGNMEMIRALIDSKIELNTAKPADGMTPLHQAVRDGQLEVVKALTFHGADLDRRTSDGRTAVHFAASLGRVVMVRFLASQGADLEQVAKCGTTALLAAAHKGYLEVIQLLAAFGTDLERLVVNKSACDLAEKNGHNHVVVWLKAVKGWPALQISAGCRFYRIAETMLRAGHADPDAPQYDARALVRVASGPSVWPWGPAVCPLTMQLMKAAIRGWSPYAHHLYHRPVQKAVSAVMHVVERLQRMPADGLPTLPTEMWFFILGFVQRRWWEPELLRTSNDKALKNPRIIVTSCRY